MAPSQTFATCVLRVGGMTCASCVGAVTTALKQAPGVEKVNVALLTEKANITFDPSLVAPADLVALIDSAGFDAELLSTSLMEVGSSRRTASCTLSVRGMTCSSCVAAVTKGLQSSKGVEDAKVALLAERARVTYDPSVLTPTQLVELVESLGFDASIVDQEVQIDTNSRATHTSTLPKFSSITYDFHISGMTCASCTSSVERAIRELPGVIECAVSLLTNSARVAVWSQGKHCGARDIMEAIDSAGFEASMVEDGGSNSREQELESLSREREIAQWLHVFTFSAILSVVLMIFSMVLPMWCPLVVRELIARTVIGGVTVNDLIQWSLCTLVLFGVGRGFFVRAWKSLGKGATMDVLVVVGTSASYAFSTFVLLAAGLTPSTMTEMRTTYFETPAMLITFVSLGRYLENLAKGRTSTALAALLKLAPTSATLLLIDDNGNVTGERTISASLVQRNDLVRIKPGEKFPTDGVVVDGSSFADESMVSGEAVSVRKQVGAQVIGGTVNGAGTLDVRATRVGSETVLSQIVRLVEEAQMARAPVQDLADFVAGIFVPVVLFLGAGTFFLWMILFAAAPHLHALFSEHDTIFILCLKLGISTVVIACPCALGLAVPTAVMVGTGVGARMGILIKGGAPLEAASKVDTVVFDKTGTLTKGKMEVCEVILDFDPKLTPSPAKSRELWQCVWAAESRSEHPLGRAIARYALSRSLPGQANDVDEYQRSTLLADAEKNVEAEVDYFIAEPGLGIRALVKLPDPVTKTSSVNRRVLIGNVKFLEDEGVTLPAAVGPLIDQHSKRARTVTLVAIDNEFSGVIAVSDQPKPESKATVSMLRKMGMRIAMVTGDAGPTALAVAESIGIHPEEVYASATPKDKETIVAKLQGTTVRGGRRFVAVVGDGINDSVAISRADLGIAVGAGTDVAIDAAQVVLMRNNLTDVVTAIDLARTIFRRIQINFMFSTVYNGVTIPLAMGCLVPIGFVMPPMAAGAAMAASSLSVVLSSLALKAYRRPSFRECGWLETGEAKRDSSVHRKDKGVARGGDVDLDLENGSLEYPHDDASFLARTWRKLKGSSDVVEGFEMDFKRDTDRSRGTIRELIQRIPGVVGAVGHQYEGLEDSERWSSDGAEEGKFV
ncbi:heavy metal translocatin [Gonapodya prolifera JEL478]|uniref:P-type Cu(+) transporter n=1 Tax=Gonapodya prolifera (strain JEL478) TaxID=1344416 RepID=A0A139AEA9_GONPJ|nr:heavy metal translocatin [Gonapodya prolifera JEL478]|eukprot:KXS15156.1 heavy metal translocatin [Gonapodya prolifera JEL478]